MNLYRDREKKIGFLNCRICKTKFSQKINKLSAEVDVFCEWIDKCHSVNTKDSRVN